MNVETTPANLNEVVGRYDILWVTLDTLRYDVAVAELAAGRTPHLGRCLPDGWTEAHTPGTFTYAAHHAFLAGFLPTPARPGLHPRLVATAFGGSATTTANTWTTGAASIPEGLSQVGYDTLCVGGTGFFNLRTALSRVLPSLFDTALWSEAMGVTAPRGLEAQIEALATWRAERPGLVFALVNVSAMHQPNFHYVDGRPRADGDDLVSHAAALRYVDAHWHRLLQAARGTRPLWVVVCSDHGTAYGDDGYTGHRHAHPVVTTVPLAHFVVQP